jgi:hypothetical protein
MLARGRWPAAVLSAMLVVAMLALPATGEAKRKRSFKPTVAVGVKLPQPGKLAFSHAVFKTRKAARRGGGRAAARRKAGRPRIRARLRTRRVPRSMQIVARVARIAKRPRLYAADVAIANAKPGATRVAKAGAAQGQLEPGDVVEIEIEVTLPDGTVLRGTIAAEVEDADVNGDDPAHGDLCEPDYDYEGDFDEYQRLRHVAALYARLLGGGPAVPGGLIELGRRGLCDDNADALLRYVEALVLDPFFKPLPPPGPSCAGTLQPAPPPFAATELEVLFSCTRPATSMGFELPGGRQAQGTVAPPQLPQCQSQPIGVYRYWVFCAGGGTLPANTQTVLRVHPDTPLAPCDRVKIYYNPPSGATSNSRVFDTAPFATCP